MWEQRPSFLLSGGCAEEKNDAFTAEFAVEDTGIGIKKEEMDKLFSAFDRLDFEKTRNIEGSGLGLAISQNFLALMGSEIKVKSEYGKRGIAYNLIKKLEKSAVQSDFKYSYIVTGKNNQPAIRLYEKLNYHQIDNFGQLKDDDVVVCMKKEFKLD